MSDLRGCAIAWRCVFTLPMFLVLALGGEEPNPAETLPAPPPAPPAGEKPDATSPIPLPAQIRNPEYRTYRVGRDIKDLAVELALKMNRIRGRNPGEPRAPHLVLLADTSTSGCRLLEELDKHVAVLMKQAPMGMMLSIVALRPKPEVVFLLGSDTKEIRRAIRAILEETEADQTRARLKLNPAQRRQIQAWDSLIFITPDDCVKDWCSGVRFCLKEVAKDHPADAIAYLTLDNADTENDLEGLVSELTAAKIAFLAAAPETILSMADPLSVHQRTAFYLSCKKELGLDYGTNFRIHRRESAVNELVAISGMNGPLECVGNPTGYGFYGLARVAYATSGAYYTVSDQIHPQCACAFHAPGERLQRTARADEPMRPGPLPGMPDKEKRHPEVKPYEFDPETQVKYEPCLLARGEVFKLYQASPYYRYLFSLRDQERLKKYLDPKILELERKAKQKAAADAAEAAKLAKTEKTAEVSKTEEKTEIDPPPAVAGDKTTDKPAEESKDPKAEKEPKESKPAYNEFALLWDDPNWDWGEVPYAYGAWQVTPWAVPNNVPAAKRDDGRSTFEGIHALRIYSGYAYPPEPWRQAPYKAPADWASGYSTFYTNEAVDAVIKYLDSAMKKLEEDIAGVRKNMPQDKPTPWDQRAIAEIEYIIISLENQLFYLQQYRYYLDEVRKDPAVQTIFLENKSEADALQAVKAYQLALTKPGNPHGVTHVQIWMPRLLKQRCESFETALAQREPVYGGDKGQAGLKQYVQAKQDFSKKIGPATWTNGFSLAWLRQYQWERVDPVRTGGTAVAPPRIPVPPAYQPPPSPSAPSY